ncbi:MAG TPA: glycosyltransferase family 39 protein [Steroidobacteraceae bacterium]|nr:glycosyltransferase family 39 protein [Steroidobacteraceae bacterium]
MRRWPLFVILALAPLWLIGVLGRGAWTPDEPRELDISWRMSLQSDRSLPRLADTLFLEKPPLSYWMSATALEAFGNSPAAARVPNLFYALVAALALGALAFAADGAATAVIAALVASTALTAYRVAVWLAPDAALVCGCSVALLGVYLGFTAPPGRRKFFGYTLLHVGAAVGFMAKSAPGWLVPGLALITLIAWERRWSELRRWELYGGLLVQFLVIAPWIYEVTRTAHGTDALRTLFWNNLVGRFTKVSGPPGIDYTNGHHNTPGKYFLELPVYLLPWTLLAVAALRRAWDRIREPCAASVAWRFCICAIVPFLVLLSVAATARDIYAAPALLGFGLLIGLWATEIAGSELGWNRPRKSGPTVTRLDRFALAGTRALVGLIAAVYALILAILAAADHGSPSLTHALNAVAIVAVAGIALTLAHHEQQASGMLRSLAWTYVAYAAAMTLGGLAVFPTIDRLQDLPSLAQRIRFDTRNGPLALLAPDETTIAMIDYRLQTPFSVLDPEVASPDTLVKGWFKAEGQRAQVLVKLPGRGAGDVSRLLAKFHTPPAPDDGVAGTLVNQRLARIVRRYELPEGRRYALLGVPEQTPSDQAISPAPAH